MSYSPRIAASGIASRPVALMTAAPRAWIYYAAAGKDGYLWRAGADDAPGSVYRLSPESGNCGSAVFRCMKSGSCRSSARVRLLGEDPALEILGIVPRDVPPLALISASLYGEPSHRRRCSKPPPLLKGGYSCS